MVPARSRPAGGQSHSMKQRFLGYAGKVWRLVNKAWITYRFGGWAGIRVALAHRKPTQVGGRMFHVSAAAKLPGDVALAAYTEQILAQSQPYYRPSSLEPANAFQPAAGDAKLISFYLPQYHPIPENDAWWGRGFTEWTNVSKAVPQFVGHYQPHLPGELGFYDLRLVEVQKRQIELARQYGIHGFCYYYYWFNGRKILQRPLENLLSHPELNFPFCLCWANENWTRRWDGLNHEVLLHQSYGDDVDIGFIESISPALRDPRYLRIAGKAVLLVYRPIYLPDAEATARRWREYCHKWGLGQLHLVAVQGDKAGGHWAEGFDAEVEFPPISPWAPPVRNLPLMVNPGYAGRIFDYRHFVEQSRRYVQSTRALYRCVMPGWDNEARQPGRGRTFLYSTPELYGRWLQNACQDTYTRLAEDERLVFINAWNEWAEGAHLEPDRLHGDAYLKATAAALVGARAVAGLPISGRPETAVVIRLGSIDTWSLLLERLKHFRYLGQVGRDFNLHLMTSPKVLGDLQKHVQQEFAGCEFTPINDRDGHLVTVAEILPLLLQRRYGYVCLINDGANGWHDHQRFIAHLPEELLGCAEAVAAARQRFAGAADVGVVVPSCAVRHMDTESASRLSLLHILGLRLGAPLTAGGLRCVEGGMYWFRPVALAPMLRIGLGAKEFEISNGHDGALWMRTVEVSLELILRAAGYRIEELRSYQISGHVVKK